MGQSGAEGEGGGGGGGGQYLCQGLTHSLLTLCLYQGEVSLQVSLQEVGWTVHQQLPRVGPVDQLQGPEGGDGGLDVREQLLQQTLQSNLQLHTRHTLKSI